MIKEAVAGGVAGAPDLPALRIVLAELFESIQLVRCRKTEDGYMIEAPKEAAGVLLPHLDKWEAEGQAVAHDGDVCYLLWPGLRGEAVEPATGELIRRELPVSSEINNSLTRIPWARSSGRRSSGRVTVTGWLRSMLAAPI
jgi:hypothetical protein